VTRNLTYDEVVNPSRPGNHVRSTIQKRDAKGVIRHGAEWLALWSDPESMKTDGEKQRESAGLRARLELEKHLSAAGRSVAADPDLRVKLDSALVADFESCNIPALRGQVDSAALQRRFHDSELHDRLAPADDRKRRLFDLCERVRCQACGVALYPGVLANLVAEQTDRLARADILTAHLALLVPVAEGLSMVLRDSLAGAYEPSIDSSALWMWDRWIRGRFPDVLHALKAAQSDQAAFSRVAIPFIHALLDQIGSDEDLKTRLQPSLSPADEGDTGPDDRLRENTEGTILRPASDIVEPQPRELLFIRETEPPAALPYKAFTTSHDAVAIAYDLFDAQRLRELRESLERKRADLRRDLARLTARLQRRLLARQSRDWAFDLEDGLLDASRLDRVIVNPGFASAYKQEQESSFPDTVVAILIDNSGSMRGKPIEISCLAADLISAALDRCGVASEILGFTTRQWKGGQSAKDWVRAGRPPDPGRVNDLLHIVYKSASEPARRARASLAAMLDPGLLKENIDGEALLWASRRLLMRPEKRRILIVISDGAPVDQLTLEINTDKQILDRHLRQVIAGIQSSGAIELTAIGVKYDTCQYYPNGVRINEVENLGPGLIGMVDELLLSR
jgi:cobaltochelatase CobT